jgi:hypothetical protein
MNVSGNDCRHIFGLIKKLKLDRDTPYPHRAVFATGDQCLCIHALELSDRPLLRYFRKISSEIVADISSKTMECFSLLFSKMRAYWDRWPYGHEYIKLFHTYVGPSNFDAHWPVCVFQTLIVLSSLPLAIIVPSGLHATDLTLPFALRWVMTRSNSGKGRNLDDKIEKNPYQSKFPITGHMRSRV